jgi:hypothetical protein
VKLGEKVLDSLSENVSLVGDFHILYDTIGFDGSAEVQFSNSHPKDSQIRSAVPATAYTVEPGRCLLRMKPTVNIQDMTSHEGSLIR